MLLEDGYSSNEIIYQWSPGVTKEPGLELSQYDLTNISVIGHSIFVRNVGESTALVFLDCHSTLSGILHAISFPFFKGKVDNWFSRVKQMED